MYCLLHCFSILHHYTPSFLDLLYSPSICQGLNGLHHRTNQSVRLNLTNAVQLLEYTASQPELRNLLHGVELSNEVGGKRPAGPHGSGRLSAGVRGGGLVNADVLAADFVALSAHLDRVWGALPAGSQQPKLLGPDCGLTETQGVTPETQEGSWWQVFLARAGHVLDGITCKQNIQSAAIGT